MHIFLAPDMSKRFARNPESAAGIIEERAAAACAVQCARIVDKSRNRSGTRVNEVTFARCIAAKVSDFDVTAQRDRAGIDTQRCCNQRAQIFAAFAKPCEACINARWLPNGPDGGGNLGKKLSNVLHTGVSVHL